MPAIAFAHGWRVAARRGLRRELIDYLRPAADAVPDSVAARLRPVELSLPARLEAPFATSMWRETERTLEIVVAVEDVDPHDAGMEMLLCLGQALWEKTGPWERRRWSTELLREIEAGVEGEIDELSREAKRRLLAGRARNVRRWREYAGMSFAATAAEYVHALWHDVTVHTRPEDLPPACLHRRFSLVARWFPPNEGYRLFAVE